jgi:hypothetical protein
MDGTKKFIHHCRALVYKEEDKIDESTVPKKFAESKDWEPMSFKNEVDTWKYIGELAKNHLQGYTTSFEEDA